MSEANWEDSALAKIEAKRRGITKRALNNPAGASEADWKELARLSWLEEFVKKSKELSEGVEK